VGFVRDLPHQLVASFKATLEEAIHADLLLHVVDAASPDAEQQIKAVDDVLGELGCATAPTLVVLNKIDMLEDRSIVSILFSKKPEAIAISAQTGEGVPDLVEAIIARMRGRYVRARVETEAGNGKLLAYVSQYGHVLNRAYRDGVMELDLRLPHAEVPRVQALGGTVTAIE